MAMNHLTDEEIQEFIENPSVFAERKTHIDQCPMCSESVKLYGILFSEIKNQPAAQLSSDFSIRLAAQLMPAEKRDYSIWMDRAMFGGALLAAAVVLGIYFPRENLESIIPESIDFPTNPMFILALAWMGIAALYEFFDSKILSLNRN